MVGRPNNRGTGGLWESRAPALLMKELVTNGVSTAFKIGVGFLRDDMNNSFEVVEKTK